MSVKRVSSFFSLCAFIARTATLLAVSGVSLASTVQTAPAQVQTLHGHVRPAVKNHDAAYQGSVNDTQTFRLSMVLPLRNQSDLHSLLTRLYDPASPDYRHFLSVTDFVQRYGPTQQDYEAVAAYLRSYGFEVEDAPSNRLIVAAKATTSQVNAAFDVQMNLYQHPTEKRLFFSPDREPSLKLSVPVAHISGLDDFSLPHPMSGVLPEGATPLAVNGSGPGEAYLGSDMRAAYYGGTVLDGTGQVVGLVEFAGYAASDVALTFSGAGQTTNVPVNNVLLDGATGGINSIYGDGEPVLDIVQAIGMAPGLSQVRVYIGVGSDDPAVLNSIVTENVAKQIGCSWSWLPVDPTTADVFFQEMSAQGQSFLTASGDSGAFDSTLSPFFYPGEDQWVTAVGGTHLTTSGPAGAWISESVWNSDAHGSGGGISPDQIAIPSYQNGIANSANGGSTTLRNVPDVAMEGDYDNYNCQSGVCLGDWAGTSFAAPRWAGFMALVNQQAVESGTAPTGGVGFLNPQLYSLAQGANSAVDFHDVTAGNNQTYNQPVWFSATAGYDLTTGWGSAAGQSLINDLAGQPKPGFLLASNLSVVGLSPGGTTTDSIRVIDAGGFTDAVTLAVTSSLPTGVTAIFSPNPSSGNATLTLTAASTVAEQTLMVTIQGTSGTLSGTTTFSLTIHPASFSLSTSLATVSINQGASATPIVTVTPLYGFTGSVGLTITGVPSGVTASFTPSTTSTNSSLLLSVSSTTTPGTYPLTITGVSGSITASTTMTLAVIGPSFILSAPTGIVVGQGQNLSSYVEILDQNGFTGAVNLSATNVPTGVAITFSPNPSSSFGTMTVVAAATATPGASTVTIVGTSGNLTVSTTIQIDVVAPTFTLAAGSSVTLPVGGNSSTYVEVVGQYGFNKSVTLSVSGLPTGVTAVWGNNPSATTSSLYLYSSSSVTPGKYPIVISGVSGSETATAAATLTVSAPSFSLTTSAMTVGQGASSSGYLYVNAQYGFTGTVNLAVSGLPAGLTAAFTPSATTYYSSIAIQASASVAPGQYTATITGTSGSLTATTTMTITVGVPTFTLSAYNLTAGAGYSATSYVYISGQYGFSGTVNLSISGLPSGVTASFSPASTTYSSDLQLTVGSAVPTGNYTLTVAGVSGSKTVTTTFVLTVASPSFTISPSSATVGQGSSGSSYIYVESANGFAGSVAFSVMGLPTGVTASFSPNPGSSYTYLTLTVGSSVATGIYPLTIKGTSGSLTSSTTFTLTVAAPSFSLNSIYLSTLNPGGSTSGYTSVYALNGFNGAVTLSLSNLPAGVTGTFSVNPITNSSSLVTLSAAITATPGTYTVNLTGTSGSQVVTTAFSLTIASPTYTISVPSSMNVAEGTSGTGYVYLNTQNNFNSSVALSASALPTGITATFSPASTTGSSQVTVAVAPTVAAGSYTFTITGTSGSLTSSGQVTVIVPSPSYTITAAPSQILLAPGASVKASVIVTSVNGFSGGLTYAASNLPTGVTASFVPAITSSGSTVTLTATNSAVAGNYTATITATSGSASASTNLVVVVTAAQSVTVTTLSVTSNSNPVTTVAAGSKIRLVANVTASGSPVTAGQVYLCDAATSYCDGLHQIGTAQLNGTGSASFQFVPPTGVHKYLAAFAGTSASVASSSASSTLTVTSALLSATAIAQSGSVGNYMLTATVTGNGATAPSGNVSFVDTTGGNAVIATGSITAAPATVSQTVTQTIATSMPQNSITKGDFNGDGLVDLAIIPNTSAATVTILLSNGNGTFTSGTPLSIGAVPTAIVSGDFNRDGRTDMAVLVGSLNQVQIYLGNGDGTFSAAGVSYTAPSPVALVSGDFNEDGILDLAVSCTSSGSITLLLGNGDGTFSTSPLSSPGSTQSGGMFQADLNGDGIPDIVLLGSASVTVSLGNGDGTFTTLQSTLPNSYFTAAALADFNGDGKPDLALTSPNSQLTYILLGNGDGTFTNAGTVLSGTYVYSLTSTDINGDGKADLIATDYYNSRVITLLGNGDGTFSTGTTLTGISYPQMVVTGDWNGDGVPDIAAGSSSLTIATSQLSQKITAIATGVSPDGTGQHAVVAKYPGDSSYGASTSTSTLLTAKAGITVTWAAPSAITYGTPLSATQLNASANVSGTFLYNPAAGTVLGAGPQTLSVTFTPTDTTEYQPTTATTTLTVNKAPLTVLAANASRAFGVANPNFTGTVTGAVNADSITETFATVASSATSPGSYPIVPMAVGPSLANYSVLATNGTLIITPASASTTFALSNQNLTFLATVLSSTSGVPTGTVTFYANTSLVGSASLVNGVATYTASAFPAGDVTLSAQYGGDTNFSSSVSTSVPVLTLIAGQTALTVGAASSVSDNFTVSTPSGYTASVQFSCSGLPQNATCSFQPALLSFGGTNTSASTTMTITTGVHAELRRPGFFQGDDREARLAGLVVLPGLLAFAFARRRRMAASIRVLMVLLMAIVGVAISGCAGGGSPSNGSSIPSPAGSYSVQVTATGSTGVSQSATVTLTVQ